MTVRNKQTSIPLWWILLDSQATLDIICNAKLLRNIWTVDHVMYIHCNAGVMSTNQQGYLPGYGIVWYCPNAIANILSLHNASSRYRVEYDSEKGNRFVLTMKSGTKKVFELSKSGLYYLDASAELA